MLDRQAMMMKMMMKTVTMIMGLATAGLLSIALAGCRHDQPMQRVDLQPLATAGQLTFPPARNSDYAAIQQAAAAGQQPWRLDPFQVAREELSYAVRMPPPSADMGTRGALARIDSAALATIKEYYKFKDLEGRTHITFTAPPFRVDALMTELQPAPTLPVVWAARSIILMNDEGR